MPKTKGIIMKMTLLEKITEIQKAVPTFTTEKALQCTETEFNDLFEKALVFLTAKNDLELMCICQGYL